MKNEDLEAIYKANIDKSRLSALRAIWNAGYYAGKGTTPTTTSPDLSNATAKPVAIIKVPHCSD